MKNLFSDFFRSEKTGGFILIACTVISMLIANSGSGGQYIDFWHSYIDLSFFNVELNHSIEHWINDGLMTIFFLLVGLEIERELYVGELSNIKNALLPVIAAAGGMFVPALIHLVFNYGTPTQSGFGIPMATDIAFALGILSLAGKNVPVSLKIFLTALAIIDDLGAIAVIAFFYTDDFSLFHFLISFIIFICLYIMGKRKVHFLPVYLTGGIIMWYFMMQSGIHASIAGVLLAFAIPFHKENNINPSFRLQHLLHYPVAFIILPLFALANTAIVIPENLVGSLISRNSMGILLGLVVGKFIGIFIFSFIALKTRVASLSAGLTWIHIAGVAILGGIGFTMSIFITNLAFTDPVVITSSKMSILLASVLSAITGLIVLKMAPKRKIDEISE
jgi:NhaA family Na+:H+ antiporter